MSERLPESTWPELIKSLRGLVVDWSSGAKRRAKDESQAPALSVGGEQALFTDTGADGEGPDVVKGKIVLL